MCAKSKGRELKGSDGAGCTEPEKAQKKSL